ncbi:conserved hypothetical protein [Ricinus communis]|uniref:Uncharacterized protein n=1 Tax=Ricinus communis TaxID=3988 RepID=B9T0G2_RICCO|nr:conserved hypothetical protein [Ricinus communis]
MKIREAHGARPIADHKQKPLLRKVASEKLVKRLDPRRADPSKGISAVGRSRPVGGISETARLAARSAQGMFALFMLFPLLEVIVTTTKK